MGEGFEIVDDALSRLARDLSQVGGRVDRAMDGMDRPGDLGTPELTGACNDFHDEWTYGVKELKKKVDDISESVTATASAYHEVETHTVARLDAYRMPS